MEYQSRSEIRLNKKIPPSLFLDLFYNAYFKFWDRSTLVEKFIYLASFIII